MQPKNASIKQDLRQDYCPVQRNIDGLPPVTVITVSFLSVEFWLSLSNYFGLDLKSLFTPLYDGCLCGYAQIFLLLIIFSTLGVLLMIKRVNDYTKSERVE